VVLDHRIEGIGDVDAEDLLAFLDVDNVHEVGHDELGFSCLFLAGHYNGDRNPSAHINRESLLWRCKGCGRAGNLIELVKTGLPHGTTHVEALRWLREHFGEVVRKPRGGSLTADLTARDIGYDTWTQRVTIPVRDETGTLIGFKGRALDDRQPKYSLLGDTEDRAPRYGLGYGWDMHNARNVVFGLDRARGGDALVLVEGELNAIACHAAGVTNAVAPGTTSITDEQLWLLRAHADKLILFYDSDEAGSGAVWGRVDPYSQKFYPGLVEKISPYFRLYDCDEHEGDPASMAPEEIRSLVTGARHWLGLAFPPPPAI
jgi:hypothetical protein